MRKKGLGLVFGTPLFFQFLLFSSSPSSSLLLVASVIGQGALEIRGLCREQDEASARVARWQGDSSKSAAKDCVQGITKPTSAEGRGFDDGVSALQQQQRIEERATTRYAGPGRGLHKKKKKTVWLKQGRELF